MRRGIGLLRRVSWPTLVLGLVLGVALTLLLPLLRRGDAASRERATFDQAYRIVRDRFVERDKTAPADLIHDAIRGMVEGLGDTGHSRFLTPEQRQREDQARTGRFVGIGVEMGERDGRAVVVTVFPDSPAAEAGMRAGDRFVRIDGADVSTLPLAELRPMLRGAEGTRFQATIMRRDATTFPVTLERRVLYTPFVRWSPIQGTGLWQIAIGSFGENVSTQLDQAIEAARGGGATGIVLDLRDNPGGLLDEAIQVTGRFVRGGVVLLERDRGGATSTLRVKDGATATDLPVVVLINGGSASAAEVVAAALLYHQRAVVVGSQSFGTGTVLQQFGLPDGSALLLGVREWLTPAGEPLRGRGVTPTQVVTLPQDIRPQIPRLAAGPPVDGCTTADLQLQAAIARLGVPCPGR